MEIARKRNIVVIVIAVCAVLAIAIILPTRVIGVTTGNIGIDAIKSQQIDSEWSEYGSYNDTIAAFIFYDSNLENHSFSVYLNRRGFSFGWFFQSGGSSSTVMNGVQMFDYGANGSAIISMNKDNVERIEYGDGEDITVRYVDTFRPFAVVLPANHGAVTLYSDNGSDVPITVVEQRS